MHELRDEREEDEDAPFTGEELVAASNRARDRVIGPKLRAVGLDRWADDVAGEVVISAWKARASFDPDLGSLQAWVNRIAQRRAADRIRDEARRNGDLLREGDSGRAPEEQLAAVATGPDARVDDVAVAVAQKLAVDSWLGPIMAATAGVMDPTAFVIAFQTHVRFDCDIKAAAVAFDLPEARVREAKRQLELYAQVILRAWHKRRELHGGQVRLADLVECLPEEGTAGAWTQTMGQALLGWRGRLDEVPVSWLEERTGWSFDTARQYLSVTRTLLRVALGVIRAPGAGDAKEE